jgi:ATP-dependent RNA circularization protein (DNA/RNA ligase family)
MKITKSTFIENYKKKVSDSSNIGNIDEAIHYAFKLTDTYGIMRINKAILEASIEYQVDENELREQINNASFMLNERKTNE